MKYFFIGIGVLVLASLGGIFLLPASSGNDSPADTDVLGVGIHWHPQLEIFVKGKKVDIPQGIGIGAVHMPIHTHDDLPVLHLEFGGAVRSEDVMLGRFFENWGKDIREFGENMRMTVNGVENTEYERYIMKDGDRIELHYE